ncbi:RICIN domain-containing protein [Streptomyces boninensis]|uniref:RICIN domain-containing protein n=1 Tax=Streptomyces boninensis TaxID=2039455 RepID=UPI003B20FA18
MTDPQPPESEDPTEVIPAVPPTPPQESTAVMPPITDGPPLPPPPAPAPERRVPVRAWVAVGAILACALAGLGIGALMTADDDSGPPPSDAKGKSPAASPSPGESSPSPTPTGPAPVLGGPYLMVNADTGTAADVRGASVDDGAPVIAFNKTGTPNQRLTLLDAGNGLVQIKVEHSGKCLQSDSATPDAPVQQLPCANSDVQHWRLNPDGDAYTLTLANGTAAIGTGSPDAEGLAPLQLQEPGQRWTFVAP